MSRSRPAAARPSPPPPGTPHHPFQPLSGHQLHPLLMSSSRLGWAIVRVKTSVFVRWAVAWWAEDCPGVPWLREKGSTTGRHIPRTTILVCTTTLVLHTNARVVVNCVHVLVFTTYLVCTTPLVCITTLVCRSTMKAQLQLKTSLLCTSILYLCHMLHVCEDSQLF